MNPIILFLGLLAAILTTGTIVEYLTKQKYTDDISYCEKNSGAEFDRGYKEGFMASKASCCQFDQDSVDALKYYSKHKDGGIALTVLRKYKIK